MKSKKRVKQLQEKRAAKEQKMRRNGGKSNYARKSEWLKRHGLHGTEITDNQKPWKSSK